MFEGEQLNQFIAASASSRTSLPIPFSFPLHQHQHHRHRHHHHLQQQPFPPFDPLFPSHHHHHALQLQTNLLPRLHQKPEEEEEGEEEEPNKQVVEANGNLLLSTSMELEREIGDNSIDPWSDEEVLALLRIRSTIDPWFPDFTWEHVSRKLSELGFKRSAHKCKEKFEEESSRHFITATVATATTYTKNNSNRFLSELEQICHGDHNPTPLLAQQLDEDNVEDLTTGTRAEPVAEEEEDSGKDEVEEDEEKRAKESKRRKRQSKFEMFKEFCQEFVNKMMAQQEKLHNKLIEDMVKRDEENVAMEEAWKKQELEKIDREMEMRAQEQAMAGDRQSKLIKYLNKLASSSSSNNEELVNFSNNASSLSSTSTSFNIIQNTVEADSSSLVAKNTISDPPSSQNTSSHKTHRNFSEREDMRKRWPRDEVMALIKLRCNVNNINNHNSNNELGGNSNINNNNSNSNNKGPLWERISQGMMELGYKRSAKRCKEKWENINKYFRKIKDNGNKKRSIDSRTCPYFHQLTTLYSQGTLEPAPPLPPQGSCPVLPPEAHPRPPPENGVVAEECGKSLIEAPASLDFGQF